MIWWKTGYHEYGFYVLGFFLIRCCMLSTRSMFTVVKFDKFFPLVCRIRFRSEPDRVVQHRLLRKSSEMG